MLRASVAIAVIACASVAIAAPRSVRGVVSSAETGRLVIGATVLTDRGEVAVTDLDGYFSITVNEDRELTFAAPGFATKTIRVPAGDTLVRVELTPAKGSEIIEISGKAPEETKPLSYQLTADEIRFLPGAANDVLRATQALPGVSRIPFSFGGIVLRGTSPRDTGVYIDGVEVPIAFHLGGVTSVYPGSMLDTITLTSGGFDASHGRAQGGLVTLTTREPRTDVWRTGGSIGLLDSSAFVEGPWQGGGLLAGVRYSYLGNILEPFVDEEIPLPTYVDVQLRTSFGDPRKRGRITPMLFGAIDRVTNDEFSFTSTFVRAAVPYTRAWGPLTLRVVPWIGVSNLEYVEHDNGRDDSIARPTVPGGVRSELVRDYKWGHLRGGIDLDAGYLAQTTIDSDDRQETVGTSLGWIDVAAWGETRIAVDGNRFAIKPGLRLDYYGIAREAVIDPRLNIHQRLRPGLTLRQAIGRYHQPPIPADVDRVDGNPELDSSYIDQASLGIDAELGDSWLAALTTFAGYGHNIGVEVVSRDGEASAQNYGGLGPTLRLLLEKQLGVSSYRENAGRARLGGIEVLLKRSTPRWFLLFAYTLAWSQRVDDPVLGRGWRPFELDQRHNLNAAASTKLGKWRVGARVQLVSGNPYSPAIVIGMPPDLFPTQDPFGGRLPWFFHLDVRADRNWQREWGAINLYLDIQNVTNRRNVEGRDVEFDERRPNGYDEDVVGLPLVPFIGVEFIPH